MMKQSSISLLQKLNKSEKNKAYYDIFNKNSDLNQEMSILKGRKENLSDELLLNKNYNDEFIMINYSSNWYNALSQQIDIQQVTVINLLNSIELSKLHMREIIKNSLLYQAL